MKNKRVSFVVSALMVVSVVAHAATNDLSAALQRGLFEEEANHNLDAAIQAYQSVVNQYDKDRKLAATAIFRLGESYRKQGKTNEATAQYERVLREFTDQRDLLTPSRQNLAMLGRTSTAAPGRSQAAREEQKRLLQEEIKLAEKELSDVQKQRQYRNVGEDAVLSAQRTVLQLKRQLAALEARPVADLLSDLSVAEPATSIETEEVKRIQALIKESPDLINAPNSAQETLLQRAAAKGESAVVKLLLDNGAAADGPKQPGLTSLHYAAGNGHKAVVDLLLARGAKVDARSESGVTPLHVAALKGYGVVAKALMDAGAAVNARTHQDVSWGGEFSISYSFQAGQTPLHAAAKAGYSAVVELLVSKGADLNVQDAKGRTPLSYAAERRDEPMAKTLLAAHADPNAAGLNLPANQAAWNGDIPLLELLLSNGADPNKYSLWGGGLLPFTGPSSSELSPLSAAINGKHPDAVRLLIRHKANPDAPASPGGTPLIFLALSELDTLKALLEGGANANARDPSGVSALVHEINAGNQAGVQLLLAHGADVNAASQAGVTPLHLAASSGHKGIADLLLQKGAEVNARTQAGDTPLHLAVGNNRQELVELLLTNKADPNMRNNAGITPLSLVTSEARPPGALPTRIVGATYPGALPPVQAIPTRPSRPAGIADLLRRHGALEDVPRPDVIQVRRPEINFSEVAATKGTNDWNQFTVLEILAMESGVLTKLPQGESQERLDQSVWSGSPAAYPDLEKVRIKRPGSDFKSWQEQTVDLSPVVGSGDCSKNVPVEWGDVIEVPEADHPLNEPWPGYTTNQWVNFQKCLSRTVEVVVKGRAAKVTLALEVTFDRSRPISGISGITFTTHVPFWIKPALRKSNVLLASSDLSRVKVTRKDPNSGKKREWILDCSDSKPAPDFWLRDGDVIEVPDKT